MVMKYLRSVVCVLIALFSATMFIGCDSSIFYDEHQTIDQPWGIDEKVDFNVTVEQDDLPHIYNFYIDMRNSKDYPYSNAFLFIKTVFPDGGVAQDTMECPLSAPTGEWYGKESASHVDNRFYLRKNIVFPQTGVYKFEVWHGLRDSNVVGIESVGLRIEEIR
jgi:gliding motility-associated lipoprotein GldH